MTDSDGNPPDKTTDYVTKNKKVDVLLANFEQYYRMAIDHHTKAGSTSHILLVIVGAILVLVGYDGQICKDPNSVVSVDVVSAILVFLIGCFGAVWAGRQMERYRRWEFIAVKYQNELKELMPEFKTGDDYRPNAKEHLVEYHHNTFLLKMLWHFFNWVRDRYLWVILHLLVLFLGVILFGKAVTQTCDPSVPTKEGLPADAKYEQLKAPIN